MRKRFTRTGNRIGVGAYQVLGGRFMGGGKEVRVLVLTVPGRRTGQPRSTCVQFLKTEEGYVVWGTASGARRDPDWFRNLRRAKMADVRVGRQYLRVRPRELLGAERDRVWNDIILTRLPSVQKYATRAGRTIPVAVLAPTRDRAS